MQSRTRFARAAARLCVSCHWVGPAPKGCRDGKACTNDLWMELSRCAYPNLAASATCGDGSACEVGEACTIPPGGGVVTRANAFAVSDGATCICNSTSKLIDTCASGSCEPGPAAANKRPHATGFACQLRACK